MCTKIREFFIVTAVVKGNKKQMRKLASKEYNVSKGKQFAVVYRVCRRKERLERIVCEWDQKKLLLTIALVPKVESCHPVKTLILSKTDINLFPNKQQRKII